MGNGKVRNFSLKVRNFSRKVRNFSRKVRNFSLKVRNLSKGHLENFGYVKIFPISDGVRTYAGSRLFLWWYKVATDV